MKWNNTDKRFVAFFDIMGFKELVARNSHSFIVEKLKGLKHTTTVIESLHDLEEFPLKMDVNESRTITFSDSIMIFSKDDSLESLNKIILDASVLIFQAIEFDIPIKGALSYGEVTLDFDNSLFFGQPIIDAYLLHEDLFLYSAILDHTVEAKINGFNLHEDISSLLTSYRVPLKKGRVEHIIIRPPGINLEQHINNTKNLYRSVSGSPRTYIDNTLDFLNKLKNERE